MMGPTILRSVEIGKIPTFANAPHENPMKFLKDLREYMELNQIKDDRRLALVDQCLKADVSTWWQVYRDYTRTYEEFHHHLLSKFWSKQTQRNVYWEIYSGKYEKNKKVGMATHFLQYVSSNMALVKPIEEEELIEIMSNHYSHEVQNIILSKNINTISDMEQLLRRLDARRQRDGYREDRVSWEYKEDKVRRDRPRDRPPPPKEREVQQHMPQLNWRSSDNDPRRRQAQGQGGWFSGPPQQQRHWGQRGNNRGNSRNNNGFDNRRRDEGRQENWENDPRQQWKPNGNTNQGKGSPNVPQGMRRDQQQNMRQISAMEMEHYQDDIPEELNFPSVPGYDMINCDQPPKKGKRRRQRKLKENHGGDN